MPILERDPWRLQYFEHVKCPETVSIPTDDPDCWQLYPRFRWIYNKLNIAESQGLPCGPHGVMPDTFPVFSKPITNLRGMGTGSRIIASPADMQHHHQPGHMWMKLLQGAHVSTDCAVVQGEVKWLRHVIGNAKEGGTFGLWTLTGAPLPELDQALSGWVAAHMQDYTGMMNFETIGRGIIEAHLRFADQWCDLYGQGWIEALVALYAHGRWSFAEETRHEGFSIPLFVQHGPRFRHPSTEVQAVVRAMPGISSLQITFHEERDPQHQPMPPGGFRLAVINAWDLQAGLEARELLRKAFEGQ